MMMTLSSSRKISNMWNKGVFRNILSDDQYKCVREKPRGNKKNIKIKLIPYSNK